MWNKCVFYETFQLSQMYIQTGNVRVNTAHKILTIAVNIEDPTRVPYTIYDNDRYRYKYLTITIENY